MGLFGNLLGTVLGGTKKPTVPKWNDVTLAGAQTAAINANTSALPGAENLAAQTNAFNQSQITAMLNSVMPGFSQTAASATSSIADLVAGKIPTDVSQAVQSSSAAQALTGGFGGSGMAGNLTARDLGLTSLNLMQSGITAEESWTKMIDQLYAPGQFNLSSMFITPQQEFADTMQNQEQSWNVQWLKNQISAMPDPTMEALGQFVGGIGDAAASYFTAGSAGNAPSNSPSLMGGITQNASPSAQSWYSQGTSGTGTTSGSVDPWNIPGGS